MVALYPVADPLARFRYARSRQDEPPPPSGFNAKGLVASSLAYFGDEAAMEAASVTRVVATGEARALPPVLVAQPELDDNVPPALTLQVVDALIRANKDFDLLVMPNHNHLSIYRDGYFFRRTFEFFLRHLVGVEPEPGYKLPGLPRD